MRKKKSHVEFVKELKIKNPYFNNLELLTQYVNAKTHIKCKCKMHNYVWEVHPWSLLQGCGCPICGRERTAKSVTSSHKDFIEKMALINSNIDILSIYTKASAKIKCQCKVCGDIWYPTANNLLSGHGCKNCSNNLISSERRKSNKKLREQSKELLKIMDIDFSYYKNKDSKLPCVCKICNNKWNVTYRNLMAGRGCPNCNKISKGESKILYLLTTKGINFTRNYSFDKLVSNHDVKLSYDFYLPDYNLLIEFQGEQHEHPIEHFGGKEKFKIQKEHDKRKREYAKSHNIKLLEIWYWDFNNIEQILNKKLNINSNKKSA